MKEGENGFYEVQNVASKIDDNENVVMISGIVVEGKKYEIAPTDSLIYESDYAAKGCRKIKGKYYCHKSKFGL